VARKLPPLNALRAFEAAARTGSFKEAAAELHVAQSAISHHIAHLEDHLQSPLFIRQFRSVELTQQGRQYLHFVTKAFDLIHQGTRELTASQGDNTLVVQTYSTFAVRWLLPRLGKFQLANPQTPVRLISSQWDPLFSKREVDVAVSIARGPDERVAYEYLFSPTLFPVCSPSLLKDGKPIQTPSDLAAYTLLQVHPSAGDWEAWIKLTGATGLNPDAALRFDSYDHALRMAAKGLGVSLAMQPYVSQELEDEVLVNPLPDHVVAAPSPWYLAFLEDSANLPRIRAFRAWLKQEVIDDSHLAPLVKGNEA